MAVDIDAWIVPAPNVRVSIVATHLMCVRMMLEDCAGAGRAWRMERDRRRAPSLAPHAAAEHSRAAPPATGPCMLGAAPRRRPASHRLRCNPRLQGGRVRVGTRGNPISPVHGAHW